GLQSFFGKGHEVTVTPRGACLIADLSGGWETYFNRLSSKTRYQYRRMLRGMNRAGIHFEIATTEAEAASFFEQLISLHQARWAAVGKPGCFSQPRFTRFHRALVLKGVGEEGEAVLGRLSLGEEPLAVIYGFSVGDHFHFYQSGMSHRTDLPIESPGIAANLLLMERLIGHGIKKYDFL